MSLRARVLGVAALAAAALSLAPLLPGPGAGLEPVPSRADAARSAPREPLDPGFARAPQGDPRFPVGAEFCTPSEHYAPASPPVGPETDVAGVIEDFRRRTLLPDMLEPSSSVRWSGREGSRFEAELVFYRRGEGETREHRTTWIERAPGEWSLIDYTVQRVSEREDEPLNVLAPSAPEWRSLASASNPRRG